MNRINLQKIRIKGEEGYALLAVLMLIGVLAALFNTYMMVSKTELGLVKTSRDSSSGFNAAEAGLNIRAEEIRNIFLDYSRPGGSGPASGITSCDAGDTGTGDYECKTHEFSNQHTAVSYVTESAGNPIYTIIPPGEPYAGLNTQEYRYTVTSVGRNTERSNEAILDLAFKSRKVPLFQFAIFFKEDLEFFNGASMTVTGPVHTNGNLYLSPQDGGTTQLANQVTVAGTFYRGQKSQSSCAGYTGTASAKNPSTYVNLPDCSGSRNIVSNVSAWNDNIKLGVDQVTVPSPEDMQPFSDGEYWQRADLRLVLRLTNTGAINTTNSPTGVEVVNTAGVTDTSATTALNNATNCPGLVTTGGIATLRAVGSQGPGTAGNQLRLYREYQYDATTNDFQRTMEVDVQGLLNCIQRYPSIMGGRLLNDLTEDGLVFHFTIDGPLKNDSQNNYSIRLRNGATLQSNVSGASTVKGMTIVSDQAIVVWGNYNSGTWIPAALMSDTLWLLSTGWVDADSYITDVYTRDGSATTVNAALVSGIRRTGDANGTAGQDKGVDTNGGGVINVFRFNEWFRVGSSSIPDFNYTGSIVSLGAPIHSQSTWGPFTYYSAPNRVWSYDTRFNTASNLPPMTPSFVYLQQQLFVRDYQI